MILKGVQRPMLRWFLPPVKKTNFETQRHFLYLRDHKIKTDSIIRYSSSCVQFCGDQRKNSTKKIFESQLMQKGQPSKRELWGWLNSIFNKYDSDRVEQVGANRACAEWLLRCGAAVRWKTHQQFTKDYNNLPVGGPRLTIAEVDATDSAIMNIGFEHFKGCKDIERVVLHKATYIDDEALRQLQYLRGSLKQLQVSSCGNVTAEGLKYIAKLPHLEYLLLYDFPAVKDKEAVARYLEEHLPQCTVLFTYASSAEQEEMQRLKEQREADAAAADGDDQGKPKK